jgi:hypothetical protein
MEPIILNKNRIYRLIILFFFLIISLNYNYGIEPRKVKDKQVKVKKEIILEQKMRQRQIKQILEIDTILPQANPFSKPLKFYPEEHKAKENYYSKYSQYFLLKGFSKSDLKKISRKQILNESPYQLALNKYREVIFECKKDSIIDSIFISHVINNMGYSFLYNSGINHLANDSTYWLIDREKIKNCMWYFEKALEINKNNNVASDNLHYLSSVISDQLSEPPYNDKNLFNFISRITPKLLDYTFSMNFSIKLDYNYLLDNKDEIVKIMSVYDEILLVVDHSGSMTYDIGIKNKKGSRFDYLQNTMLYVFDKLSPKPELGIISVGTDICENNLIVINVGELEFDKVVEEFNSIQPGGLTPLNRSLDSTQKMFTGRNNRKALLLLSDGINSYNCEPRNLDLCDFRRKLKIEGIDVYIFSVLLKNGNNDIYSDYECFADKLFGINRAGVLETESIIDSETFSFSIPHQILPFIKDKYIIPITN